MATKRSVSKTRKSSPYVSQIQKLQSCVSQDLVKLARCYPKVLSDIDRAIKVCAAALKKAQTKAKSKTLSKKKPAGRSKIKSAAAVAYERKLRTLTAQKLAVQSSWKKFAGQRKALQQFDKTWSRQNVRAGSRSSTSRSGKAKSMRPVMPSAMLNGHHAWGGLQ